MISARSQCSSQDKSGEVDQDGSVDSECKAVDWQVSQFRQVVPCSGTVVSRMQASNHCAAAEQENGIICSAKDANSRHHAGIIEINKQAMN